MSTVVTKNLAVQNSEGTASTNISFDGTKLVSAALDNSITATANLHDLGVGQTWQAVTASRALGVTYTNTTGKVIAVSVSVQATGSGCTIGVTVDGVITTRGTYSYGASAPSSNQIIVPPGSTYSFFISGGSGDLSSWAELR